MPNTSAKRRSPQAYVEPENVRLIATSKDKTTYEPARLCRLTDGLPWKSKRCRCSCSALDELDRRTDDAPVFTGCPRRQRLASESATVAKFQTPVIRRCRSPSD